MGYIFQAWLEEGAPRLRVINPANGSTSLTWDCPSLEELDVSVYRREMQQLFKKLILLASAQEIYYKNRSRSQQSMIRRSLCNGDK